MKIFRGTYEHTLDKKGRVAVPKNFRDGLFDNQKDEIIVTFGLSKQLFVFSKSGWEKLAANYDSLPGEDADLLDRFFGASAMECTLDAQGRILVPPVLKTFADLEKDVVWVGQRGKVELWSAQRWSEALDAVQQGIFIAASENLQKAYAKMNSLNRNQI